MKLSRLLKNVEIRSSTGLDGDIDVNNICDDSRKVASESLFVAIKGLKFDAHTVIDSLVAKGITVVVGEKYIKSKKDFCYIRVPDSRKALSVIASNFYGNPKDKLKIVGVTGTDGKTTTCNMIYSIIRKSGKNVGLISTVSAKIGNKSYDTGLHVTNPEPLDLHKFLKLMVDKVCEYCVLEVSSHGLDQGRVHGIKFECCVVTNVTNEHLDYHKSYKKYLLAKAKLISQSKVAFVNKDCKSFKYFKKLFKDDNYFSLEGGIEDAEVLKHLNSYFPGDYNLSNASAAQKVCLELGFSTQEVYEGLLSLKSVEGRFEKILLKGKPIIVDFAHTPNALQNVLALLRKRFQKVTVVFGCAGERYKEKRSVMGSVAAKFCNHIVLTSEDPRTENPLSIINEIASGIKGNAKVYKIPDRRDAIKFAIKELYQDSDVIVITGKGHEKSMCVGLTEYPWSDRKVVLELIAEIENRV